MKKIVFSILLFSLGLSSFCTTWTITNSGFTFSPATVTITFGDSVNFSLGAIHNAVEVSQATWDLNGTTPLPGFSVPLGGGLVLPTQLAIGTHYYVCTVHAAMGMKGIIIVQGPAGIPETSSMGNFSIYPNPSRGKFKVEINNPQYTKNYELEIYDLLGNKIFTTSQPKQQNSIQIDLSGFTKGIYFVRLYDGEEIFDRKVVIQ
jgi:plastocyanin